MEIPQYVCVHIYKKNCKFCNFRKIHTFLVILKFVNFFKGRLISNVSECLLTNFSHIWHAHLSKSKRCVYVKSSTYFHVKTKMLVDFQICISVPLRASTQLNMIILWKRTFFYSSKLKKNIYKALIKNWL